MTVDEIKALVRDVPDFPQAGILFRDVTTLIGNGPGFAAAVGLLADRADAAGVDMIAGIEARGFIFGAAVAARLGVGFVPLRKPGKLPANTIRQTYKLEYGEDCLEIHADALDRGDRVLIVDDVIATGGTAKAAGDLVTNLGAVVSAYVFLVELSFLDGRKRLDKGDVLSLIRY